VVGAEALVRWHHPEHGQIPPDEFIPIAESTGLIQPLGRFVLETALEQAHRWHQTGISLGLAVNLSVRNLLEPTLVDRVAGLIARAAVAPGTLTLEITESGVMTDPEAAIAMLWGLRRARSFWRAVWFVGRCWFRACRGWPGVGVGRGRGRAARRRG
jgi:EAL domain-containing protein (putative c-di-GMP-specific phosphodiesterase class I)